MTTLLWILLFLATSWVLAYHRASIRVWTISIFLIILLHNRFSYASRHLLIAETAVFLVIAIVLNIPKIRQILISRYLLALFRKRMPTMSRTEREALEAGTVGWEAELFAGMPNWQKFIATEPGKLNDEEQAFLDGPVEELCKMTDNWDIIHNRLDLPPETWQFLKEQGFFGLIIPKQYGGKGFSAYAHLSILIKLNALGNAVATTVSVPNSLGPAELLLHYGTEEQKNHYLPRLARGEEIPCFALTSPVAGSDASSIPDSGIVCHGNFEGKEIIGIRLNWDKRYITLAPVATVLGLAFKLYDPDHLIGNKKEIGITCALIPTKHPGITIGRRHLPLGAAFLNGPTQGKDVFIPLDWIIGGTNMAGQGWRMLMECLSAGRAISLPSTSVGGSKKVIRATGAYARIRKQFHLPIGNFEGIKEALTRIGAYTYTIDAAVKMTVAAIDRGEKPAIASAMMKYHATERARKIINDAMDIHGGKGICLGPHNYLGHEYQTMPISVTVEGANILTRNLIIFGQGSIRCHPHLHQEIKGVRATDPSRGLTLFDQAIFAHMGYSLSCFLRTLFLSITGGRFVSAPKGHTHRYFQQLTRYSSAFSLFADTALLVLGGDLKRKEALSARLGDILSLLYLGSAVLKHYIDDKQPESDLPLVDWCCQDILFSIQQTFDALLCNFPNRFVTGLLRILIFPYGKCLQPPRDSLTRRVTDLLMAPTDTRSRLTAGICISDYPNNILALLDKSLFTVITAEPLEKRLHKALHENKISGITTQQQIDSALSEGIISGDEAKKILAADAARRKVIAVDDFAADEFARTKHE